MKTLETETIETVEHIVESVKELPLGDVIHLFVSFIPVGLLICFLIILIGLGISGIMKIFKKI